MIKKIGFDVHGVIDSDPEFFSLLIQDLLKTGWEVHIITGKAQETVEKELQLMNITYTHLFSIADYHKNISTVINYDEKGNPWMDKKLWDRTKGDYCLRENILLHIDDTERYKNYFKTNFSLFNKVVHNI